MSGEFHDLYRALCFALLAQTALASDAVAAVLRPSDCLAGHADSTCADRVGAPTPAPPPPPITSDPDVLYRGPLAGLLDPGPTYWGFDFLSYAQGVPSPLGHDVYFNRSGSPVDIDLLFTMPSDHPCGPGCLPRVEFRVGPNWELTYLPFRFSGNTASVHYQVPIGGVYGIMIAMQQTHDAQLVVTVPKDRRITLQQVGLDAHPEIAEPIAPPTGMCACPDGTEAACFAGTRYSNGLMGPYNDRWGILRPDAWSNCPARDGG